MTSAPPRLRPHVAELIWQILVEECGCRDSDVHDRGAFIFYLCRDKWPGNNEWRFMGALGFGGKFYNDGDKWRVGCYREDETPERLAMIDRANARLAELRARIGGPHG